MKTRHKASAGTNMEPVCGNGVRIAQLTALTQVSFVSLVTLGQTMWGRAMKGWPLP